MRYDVNYLFNMAIYFLTLLSIIYTTDIFFVNINNFIVVFYVILWYAKCVFRSTMLF